MRIEYVCHATLLVDTGEVSILTDPWLQGAAYCDQWWLFPRPVDTERARRADVTIISHGHEDHLHEESLRTLASSTKILYPYYWYGGTAGYLESLGFTHLHNLTVTLLVPRQPVDVIVYPSWGEWGHTAGLLEATLESLEGIIRVTGVVPNLQSPFTKYEEFSLVRYERVYFIGIALCRFKVQGGNSYPVI